MEFISLRAHHVENVFYNKFVNFTDFERLHADYNPEFRKFLKELYQALLAKPSMIVKIVEGLDDICNSANPTCDKDLKNCLGRSRDELVQQHYGLSVGEKYRMEDILRRAEKFKETTGFITPLNWVWQTNDLNSNC